MAGYNDNIKNGDGGPDYKLKTRWPTFLPEREEPDTWQINLEGLTVGLAYSAYDARQLLKKFPGALLVEPLEVVNKRALRMVRALQKWEQEELDRV